MITSLKKGKRGHFIIGVIPFLLMSGFLFAQEEKDLKKAAQDAGRLSQEIEERVHHIFNDCPLQIQAEGFSNACEDLFGAACLKSNAKVDEHFQLQEDIDRTVNSAYDATIHALGKPSLEKAYFDYLGEKGLEVKPDLSEELKQELLGKAWPSKSFFAYFKNIPELCYEVGDDLREDLNIIPEQGGEEATIPLYEKLYKKYKDAPLVFFNKKSAWYQDNVVQLYSDIVNTCENMQNNSSNLSDSATLPTACSEAYRYQMRSRLMDVLRKKDSPEGEKAKTAFITKELAVLVELISYQVEKDMGKEEAAASSLEKAKRKVRFIFNMTRKACYSYTDQARDALQNYRNLFFKNLSAAKPTVEALMDQTFSETQRTRVQALYDQVHGTLLEVVEDTFGSKPELKGSDKYQKMKQGLKSLKLRWPQKPSADLYKTKEGFAVPVLDFEKVPPQDEMIQSFQDPDLEYLRALNAHYNLPTQQGELELEEAVNILPAITLLSERNPLSVMEVLAHELGHKISYESSQANGYDLRATYKKLVGCLRRADSVGLQEGQEEETTADWLSSQVMGRVIELFYPKEQRKQATLNMARFYCEAEKEELYKSMRREDFEDSHLEETLRVNGIFGANSKIREHLGCDQNKKYKFSECTLDGVVQ